LQLEKINLYAAWIGIGLGFLAGAVSGLFFHKETWLGGYASWQRRMTRLGHISFFGIAFINIAYALSVRYLAIQNPGWWPSVLFIIGAVSMPLICYLSAFMKPFRHLFVIPVLSLLIGATMFIFADLL
jgi:hypothetical protein